MNDLVVTVGGWVLALLVALVSAVTHWRKGNVDETTMVLGKWKELVDAHQTQIGALTQEITALRERLVATETAFADYRRVTDKRIRELEDENAGLKRAIVQNSQSAAFVLTRQRKRNDKQDVDTSAINERLDTFDKAGDNSRNRSEEDKA